MDNSSLLFSSYINAALKFNNKIITYETLTAAGSPFASSYSISLTH